MEKQATQSVSLAQLKVEKRRNRSFKEFLRQSYRYFKKTLFFPEIGFLDPSKLLGHLCIKDSHCWL